MKYWRLCDGEIRGHMITWNYRVFREANGDYLIREVFYAEDGSILGCPENAVEPLNRWTN